MSLAVLAATAAVEGGAWYSSQPKVHSDNSGEIPVIDGISLDARAAIFQDAERNHQGEIRTLSGGWANIGTVDAVNASYDITMRYSELLGQYTRLLEQNLSNEQKHRLHQGFINSGVYPWRTVCTPDQQDMIFLMVSMGVSYGIALRLQSRMYEAAGLERTTYVPSKWSRRHINLANIVQGSFLNPLAMHISVGNITTSIWQIHLSDNWEGAGIIMQQEWCRAYGVNLDSIPGADMLAEDFRVGESRVTPGGSAGGTMAGMSGSKTMGVGIGTAVFIALILLAVGGAIAMVMSAPGVSTWLTLHSPFAEAQIERYRELSECATDPNRTPEERALCRAEAASIAEESNSFTPPWSTVSTILIMAGIGVAGYIGWRMYGGTIKSKAKKYITKRKTKKLEA